MRALLKAGGRAVGLLTGALALQGGSAVAQVSWRSHLEPDCSLILTEALGIPEESVHAYRFKGTCQTYRRFYKDGGYHHRVEVGPIQLVRIDGDYDRDSGLFRETIRVEAPTAGRIALLFQCPRDPVYQSADCLLHKRENSGDEPADPEGVWKELGSPVLSKKATLADARARSEAAILAKAEAERAAARAKAAEEVRAGTLHQGDAVATVPVQTPVARLPAPGRRRAATTPLWHHIDPGGQVWRVYPDGTRAYRQADGIVVLDVGGTRVEVGRARP